MGVLDPGGQKSVKGQLPYKREASSGAPRVRKRALQPLRIGNCGRRKKRSFVVERSFELEGTSAMSVIPCDLAQVATALHMLDVARASLIGGGRPLVSDASCIRSRRERDLDAFRLGRSVGPVITTVAVGTRGERAQMR